MGWTAQETAPLRIKMEVGYTVFAQGACKMWSLNKSQCTFQSVILIEERWNLGDVCGVDYQALNKVTIPDKLPIPMKDEILDELYGSQLLSKLDPTKCG